MRRILSSIGFVGLVLQLGLLVSCAETVSLANTSRVPGATGKVEVKRSKNGNTRMEVDVEHLAKASQVDSRAVTYVVWIQSLDHATAPQNVGNLMVDDDLKGHVSTMSPLASFELVITPESSHQAPEPTGDPVFRTRVMAAD